MQELGLIALIAGMVAGFISLRAIGWMCVVGLCLVGGGLFAQTASLSVNNNTSGSVTAWIYYTDGGTYWGTGGYASSVWYPVTLTAGQTVGPVTAVFDTSHQVTIGASSASGGGGTVYDSWTVTLSSGTTSHTLHLAGAGPPTYYANGCLTNNTFYPKVATVSFSDGTDPMQQSPILPGEAWCFSRTNTHPFSYTIFVDTYDGEGNFIGQNVGGPFNAYTNTVPSVGQTGSVQYNAPIGPNQTGSTSPNNGVNSTTNLTGGQFVSGVTNLQNTIFQMGQNLGGTLVSSLGGVTNAFAGMSGSLSNLNNSFTNQPGITNDYTKWFQALSNSLAGATNSLGRVVTNQDIGNSGAPITNVFGTNLSAMLAGAFSSGNMYTQAVADSNGFYTAASGGAGQIEEGTNVVSAFVDGTFFYVPLHTSVAGLNSGLDLDYYHLDPTNTSLWAQITPWLRAFFGFLIAVGAVRYIHMRVSEEALRIGLVPGGGPAKSATAFLGSAASAIVFTTVYAALVPLIGFGVSAIAGFSGGAFVNPFSTSGMATAGTYSAAIENGLGLFQQLFPMVYALTVGVYLFFFDMLATGAVLAGQRLVRSLTN